MMKLLTQAARVSMRSCTTRTLLAVLVGVVLAGCGSEAMDGREGDLAEQDIASPGQEIFERGCFACHSIGEGDRIGPDLKDVHLRREREWLVRWLQDPMEMAKSDSIGRQLFAQFANVPMPPTELSDQEIEQVLDYVEAVSLSAISHISPVSSTSQER